MRQKNGKSFVLLNIKNYKENKTHAAAYYINETFDFEIEPNQKQESIVANDETSTNEDTLGGYEYSAESENEVMHFIGRKKDKKAKEVESSGPTPNAHDLSTKNFDERNVLKEMLKNQMQQEPKAEESLKVAPIVEPDIE